MAVALGLVLLAHVGRVRPVRLPLQHAVRRVSALSAVASEAGACGLCLIDTHNLAYRMHHAMPEVSNPHNGELVHAVMGCCNKFWSLRDQFPGYHFLCVFDDGASTRRLEMLPAYKEVRTLCSPTLVGWSSARCAAQYCAPSLELGNDP